MVEALKKPRSEKCHDPSSDACGPVNELPSVDVDHYFRGRIIKTEMP